MQQAWTVLGAIAVMAVGMGAVMADGEAANAAPRTISPWFIYQGEASIEALRPHADAVSSISVCGGCPPEFVQQCHDLGISALLLVGGHDGALFDTPERRRELIEGYLARCRETGADGIDLDFESLDSRYRDSYSALLREAAEALHADGLTLSMCVSYIMSTWRTADVEAQPGGAQIDGGWFDPAVIGQTCDMVRVMCYDMHSVSGESVGPVSTRPWARDAMRFWMQHVPRERLVMGLPTYSRDFALTAERRADSLYLPEPELPEGTDVRRVWLPYEEIHQYRYLDADAVAHLFYASDAASTRAHLQTAAELGIDTIAFWHYGAVTAEEWAAVEEWLQPDGREEAPE
ncbi:MAG: glycosyl hydrolase family 18 protein [Armatimonadota bacterium]